MADYERMYYKLFNRVTDIIEGLKAAQNETEDIYMFDTKGEAKKQETGEE